MQIAAIFLAIFIIFNFRYYGILKQGEKSVDRYQLTQPDK